MPEHFNPVYVERINEAGIVLGTLMCNTKEQLEWAFKNGYAEPGFAPEEDPSELMEVLEPQAEAPPLPDKAVIRRGKRRGRPRITPQTYKDLLGRGD